MPASCASDYLESMIQQYHRIDDIIVVLVLALSYDNVGADAQAPSSCVKRKERAKFMLFSNYNGSPDSSTCDSKSHPKGQMCLQLQMTC